MVTALLKVKVLAAPDFEKPPQGEESLLLSCLAIGIALVAVGLSRSLILDDAGDQVISLLLRFNLGSGCNIGCCLVFGSLSMDALLLLLPLQFLKL